MDPLDIIEKWISEHGSAAILRDYVALLKEQMTTLQTKVRGLEKEISDLKTERDVLKTECGKLKEYIRAHQRPYHERRVSKVPIDE